MYHPECAWHTGQVHGVRLREESCKHGQKIASTSMAEAPFFALSHRCAPGGRVLRGSMVYRKNVGLGTGKIWLLGPVLSPIFAARQAFYWQPASFSTARLAGQGNAVRNSTWHADCWTVLAGSVGWTASLHYHAVISCSLSSRWEGSWRPIITVVSGLPHSGAVGEAETEAGRWVKCSKGHLNTESSDAGAPNSPHFRLPSSAFVEAVPASRKPFIASLSISYLIYKAQCLGEILSDLLA